MKTPYYMDEKNIYSLPFSIELFKLLPYNPSLEVIIKDDGVILYARPSHTEALIQLATEKCHCTREELNKRCSLEYYTKYIDWLCIQSGGGISVWENFFIGPTVSPPQRAALESLCSAGLYFGSFSYD